MKKSLKIICIATVIFLAVLFFNFKKQQVIVINNVEKKYLYALIALITLYWIGIGTRVIYYSSVDPKSSFEKDQMIQQILNQHLEEKFVQIHNVW